MTLKTLSALDKARLPHNLEVLGAGFEVRPEKLTAVLIPARRLKGLQAVSLSRSYYLIG
jgi:hypothetical protein